MVSVPLRYRNGGEQHGLGRSLAGSCSATRSTSAPLLWLERGCRFLRLFPEVYECSIHDSAAPACSPTDRRRIGTPSSGLDVQPGLSSRASVVFAFRDRELSAHSPMDSG